MSIQYLLPEPSLELLGKHLRLEVERPRTGDRVFYDTFDGLLHAAGATLVYEGGVLTLEHPDALTELAVSRSPRRVLAGELPEGPLRDRLQPIVDVRAALPVARVRSRRRTLRVLDGEAKTVVRLIAEEATLRGGPALQRRLHVVGVRGYDKALERTRRTLEREVGLGVADEPLLDEAVARAGGTVGGVSSKLDIRLSASDRVDRAAAVVLARLLEIIRANLPGTLDDVDTEFLHDFRVAVRRTRAVQRELKTAFPRKRLAAAREDFRWLQQVTGPTRDLDVYLLEFDGLRAGLPERVRRDLDPVFDLLSRHRATERRRMVRALKTQRTGEILDRWQRLVDDMAGGRGSAPPIADVAAKRIAKVHRDMVQEGSAIGPDSPHEALHDLRKKGKELRYLLEIFGSLYPADVIKPLVKSLKALQDTLGRFQDREVQAEMLRSMRDEIAHLADGPSALMAMGLLVERLEADQDAAHKEFDERFAAFAAKEQRQLVKATFG